MVCAMRMGKDRREQQAATQVSQTWERVVAQETKVWDIVVSLED